LCWFGFVLLEEGQWGQICPFDESLAGQKAQGFDNSGPWYRVVNLTRFPLFGLSGDWAEVLEAGAGHLRAAVA
jgi:hypothetical protein